MSHSTFDIEEAADLLEQIDEFEARLTSHDDSWRKEGVEQDLMSLRQEQLRLPPAIAEKARTVLHYRCLFAQAQAAFLKLHEERGRRVLSQIEIDEMRAWLELANAHRRTILVLLEGEVEVRKQEELRAVQLHLDAFEGLRERRGYLTVEENRQLEILLAQRRDIESRDEKF